jgi:hypothetical protein
MLQRLRRGELIILVRTCKETTAPFGHEKNMQE